MFGEKLIEKRTEKNLTQEQLAEKLFVTRQAVSRWETNKTQPDLQTLGRICSILGVSPEYFIETDRQVINFNELTYSQKLEYFHLFTSQNIGLYVLTCVLMMPLGISFVGLSFSLTSAVLDSMHGAYGLNPVLWIFICLGAMVALVAAAVLALYSSMLRSTAFNNWLAQRNVIRTKKFI